MFFISEAAAGADSSAVVERLRADKIEDQQTGERSDERALPFNEPWSENRHEIYPLRSVSDANLVQIGQAMHDILLV